MNTRKWIKSCVASYFSISLVSITVTESRADSGFSSKIHLKSAYSKEINSLNDKIPSHSSRPLKPSSQLPLRSNTLDGTQSYSRFQRKSGKIVYKAFSTPQKKLVNQLAGAVLIYGLESMNMSEPVMKSFSFIKDKAKFNFGKCSQIRFSTKRIKAHNCFFDTDAKLEFHANYKMDAFNLKFNWPM